MNLKAGLQTFNKAVDYRQSFFMLKPSLISASCIFRWPTSCGKPGNRYNFKKDISFKQAEDLNRLLLAQMKTFSKVQELLQSGKNSIALVDTSL